MRTIVLTLTIAAVAAWSAPRSTTDRPRAAARLGSDGGLPAVIREVAQPRLRGMRPPPSPALALRVDHRAEPVALAREVIALLDRQEARGDPVALDVQVGATLGECGSDSTTSCVLGWLLLPP